MGLLQLLFAHCPNQGIALLQSAWMLGGGTIEPDVGAGGVLRHPQAITIKPPQFEHPFGTSGCRRQFHPLCRLLNVLRALLPGRQVTSQLKHRIGITILGGFLLFLGTRSSRGFSDIGNFAARQEPGRFASRAFIRVRR